MTTLEVGRGRWTRWRWRLRGASMWPLFAVCVVADTILLKVLPISGVSTSVSDAFVVAGFLNLAIVAVLAPLAGAALRRVRRDLPRVVAVNYAGTVLLALCSLSLLLTGLVHRPVVVAAQHSVRADALAMQQYVEDHAPLAFRRNLARADSVRLDPTFFRTCVPGSRPGVALCAFIDTSRTPPTVRVNPDRVPNEVYFEREPNAFGTG